MEHVDRTLLYCNGHRCDESSTDDRERHPSDDRTSCLPRPARKPFPHTPPTERRTFATPFCDRATSTTRRGVNSDRKRKLVLHFDVRNTILVSDSATHDNVEQALNSFLTGVTWGREDRNGWIWYSERPSLRPPCPDAITYYKSRERELVRSPADRVRLRRITGDFTSQPIGRKFRKYFDDHLRLLEWNFVPPSVIRTNSELYVSVMTSSANNEILRTRPETASVDRKLTIVGANGRLYHYLLPSFIKMLYDLEADGCRFAVILRTYGIDAPKVLDSIAHIAAGNHPLFPRQLSIGVNRTPGRIRRCPGGAVRCELPPSAADQRQAVTLETDTEVYRYMSDVEGVCGFVDDFTFWQEHNYAHSDGKPLWLDPTDPDVQHIFFDDNIRVADAEGIVDVRLFGTDVVQCSAPVRSLSIDEMAQLEDVCLVQADLLECTSNVDYFISKVRQCEANYSSWLRRHHRGDDA